MIFKDPRDRAPSFISDSRWTCPRLHVSGSIDVIRHSESITQVALSHAQGFLCHQIEYGSSHGYIRCLFHSRCPLVFAIQKISSSLKSDHSRNQTSSKMKTSSIYSLVLSFLAFAGTLASPLGENDARSTKYHVDSACSSLADCSGCGICVNGRVRALYILVCCCL
jgi:hypothetical protein